MTITVVAAVRALPGQREELLRAIDALASLAAEERGTLRYDCFEEEDPQAFAVLEQDTDAAAAISHNLRCAEALAAVGAAGELIRVDLYGELPPELLAWAQERPFAHAHAPVERAARGR